METSFMDSDGVVWRVYEDGADDSTPIAADTAPGAAWLRFDSELEVRRLWRYPDDWRGLSPVQLESLLERATTVVARFRSPLHRPASVDPPLGNREPEAP
ncbi:MAG TPA: hypothetical protein VM076_18280 [Gemmatimonadaceae bacterium]|nr:hypothetical protein [Gemmatimonadaceae bacterium]